MARIKRTYTSTEQRYMREIGERIRLARAQQQLSQDELALRAGLSRSHISKLEHAQYDPQLVTLYRISQALKLTFQDLVTPPEIDDKS